MKKNYIEPKTTIVAIGIENILAGSLSGDGLRMGISNDGADYDADSRGGSWEDEE